MTRGFLLVPLVVVTTALAFGQRRASSTDLPAVDVAAMLKTAKPDLADRLAQFKQVRMTYDPSPLTPNERQMIDQLVSASRALESMYWRQSDPIALALYQALESDSTPLARNL